MKVLSERRYQALIQATGEGQRQQGDPLAGPVLVGPPTVRTNQYREYAAQIQAIYQKYEAVAEYGVSLVRSLVDFRTSFVAGEGVNWDSTNEAVKTFLRRLDSDFSLSTTFIVELARTVEMEGECVLVPEVKQGKIVVHIVRNENNYLVTDGNLSYEGLKNKLTADKFVHVQPYRPRVGGKCSPKIASVLTQIDNVERALYDLRENNHLFGFTTPHIKSSSWGDSKNILQHIKDVAWKIGRLLVGPFEYTLVEPSGRAQEAITKEISVNIKTISTVGVPVHWLGWTDLMSNRATAEELEEMITASTKIERLCLIESIYKLIRIIMVQAKDAGVKEAINAPDDFDIDIPYVSLSMLKALVDVWSPLQTGDVVSMQTFRNKVPGINPADEEVQIQKEKDERVRRTAATMKNLKIGDQYADTHDEQGEGDSDINGRGRFPTGNNRRG